MQPSFSASSSPIEFKIAIPNNLKSLFDEKATENLSPLEIISKLREIIPYRSNIKVNDYETIYKRFTKINSTLQEKKEITHLVAKILFGSGNSLFEAPVDSLLDQDFQSSTDSEGHLSINLTSACELLTNTPPAFVNPSLVVRCLLLQRNIHNDERKLIYAGLSVIAPERREFIMAAAAPWLERFSVPGHIQGMFLTWVDSKLGINAPEIIEKCLFPLIQHALRDLPHGAELNPIPLSTAAFDSHINFMEMALALPQEQRDNDLNNLYNAFRVIRGVDCNQEILEFIEATLKKIESPNRRTQIVDLALPYLTKFESLKNRNSILKRFLNLTESEIQKFDTKYKPFLMDVKTKSDMATIFNAISLIENDQWEDILKNAQPLIQINPSDPVNVFYLTLLQDIDVDERESIVKSVLPIAQKFTKFLDIEKLISAFEEIPKGSREVVSENALPLTQQTNDLFSTLLIISNLSEVPPDIDWKNLLHQCSNLLERVTDPIRKSRILSVMGKIPPAKRVEVYAMSEALFEKSEEYVQPETVFHPKNRLEILTYEAEMDAIEEIQKYNNEMELMEKVGVIQIAINFSPAQWNVLIKRTESLCKAGESPTNKIKILKCLVNIPEEEWVNILLFSQPFLESCKSVDEKTMILEAISHISPSKRKNIINLCAPLINEAPNNMFVATILETLSNIAAHERLDVLEKTKGFVKSFDHHSYLEEFMTLISVLQPEERTRANLDLLYGVADLENLSHSLSFCLSLIAPSKRLGVISYFKKCITENETYFEELNLLEQLYLSDEEVKKLSHEFLAKALDTALANDSVEASKLADEIIRHTEALQLYEEHSLIQKASHVYMLSNPEAILDRKNPHNVYKRIQEIPRQPFTPFNPPLLSHVYEVEKYIEGEETQIKETLKIAISLNLDFMRTKAKDKKVYTFADLPKNINLKTLESLFSSFRTRRENLPKESQDRIADSITREYNDSLENLSANLFKKAFIKDLLSQTGKATDVVSKNTFYLFSILKAIEETSHVVLESGLTFQETFLLDFAKTLQNCSGGQQDGVRVVFRLLDIQFREQHHEATIMSVEVVNEWMRDSVQKVLADIFHGDALIKNSVKKILYEKYQGEELKKALKKIENINEATHQTLYLTNFLANDVGFEHDPEFDFHTSTLYPELLDLKMTDALQIFMQECSPARVMKQFQHDIAQRIEYDNKKIDADLKVRLENFKTDKPEIKKAIQSVLAEFNLGKERLSHLIINHKGLIIPELYTIPTSHTLSTIQEYFETQIAANRLPLNWRNNYLDILDDGFFYPVRGVSELGALEILNLGKYLNKFEGEVVSRTSKREFDENQPAAKSQKI